MYNCHKHPSASKRSCCHQRQQQQQKGNKQRQNEAEAHSRGRPESWHCRRDEKARSRGDSHQHPNQQEAQRYKCIGSGQGKKEPRAVDHKDQGMLRMSAGQRTGGAGKCCKETPDAWTLLGKRTGYKLCSHLLDHHCQLLLHGRLDELEVVKVCGRGRPWGRR